jgi:imidazole glycerol-phosphate synthase subunit HisH
MIAILDYNMGNIHSVRRALATVGADVLVTNRPEDLRRAERIVLPGVGAFRECLDKLNALGVIEVLHEEVMKKGKPMLGICVGMQVLATTGEEGGIHAGLGWIPGTVKRLDVDRTHGLNVPHVGWNEVLVTGDSPLFADIGARATFYFVHTYHLVPTDLRDLAATTEHGERFASAVQTNNIFATQFHPEKSQHDGLTLLSNFLKWKP